MEVDDEEEQLEETEHGEPEEEVGDEVEEEGEVEELGLYPDAGLAEAMEQVEDRGEGRTGLESDNDRKLK